MKEMLKHLKPIKNMMVFALLVLLSILTTRTSAIAQPFAPVPQTGQTQNYASGDDGDLQMGVQWPDPRFTDNNDGTVTDNLTGLIWLKNADCFGEKNWNDALGVSNNLADTQCGLSDGSSPGDWRLPNIREIRSLIDHDNYGPALPSGHPFTDVQTSSYWSSTTVAYTADEALSLLMGSLGGYVDIDHKDNTYRVWPLRGGNEVVSVAAPVPKTGQTQSYAPGDDGDLQMGVQWPDPRLTDNGDGTVTDNLTGLIWLKNADCFGDKNWQGALDDSNNLADVQCGLSDGSSPGDWRLSNVRELLSLIDYDNIRPPLPTGHPFTNVRTGSEPSSSYWSSTTVANRTEAACLVQMDPEGASHLMDDAPKAEDSRGVWPVRSGIVCNGEQVTILGTEGNDILIGTDGPDVIHGLGSVDIIRGMGGDDVICGGDGSDFIGGFGGNDIIFGGPGDDAIWGGPGNDALYGGDGHDTIYGGAGNDKFYGGDGNDVLNGHAGDDILRGNFGNDSLYGCEGVDHLYGGWGPNNGSIDNNDTCYDGAGTHTRGCEVFYEQ